MCIDEFCNQELKAGQATEVKWYEIKICPHNMEWEDGFSLSKLRKPVFYRLMPALAFSPLLPMIHIRAFNTGYTLHSLPRIWPFSGPLCQSSSPFPLVLTSSYPSTFCPYFLPLAATSTKSSSFIPILVGHFPLSLLLLTPLAAFFL